MLRVMSVSGSCSEAAAPGFPIKHGWHYHLRDLHIHHYFKNKQTASKQAQKMDCFKCRGEDEGWTWGKDHICPNIQKHSIVYTYSSSLMHFVIVPQEHRVLKVLFFELCGVLPEETEGNIWDRILMPCGKAGNPNHQRAVSASLDSHP